AAEAVRQAQLQAQRVAQLAQLSSIAAQIGPAKSGGSAATISRPTGNSIVPTSPVAAPLPVAPATYNQTTAQPAPAISPAVTANPVGEAPSAVGNFTNATGAGGTYGQLQRMRQNRGPQTGTSITPEILRRMAQQRIVGR
ncbi:MAG: hypothetical protein ABWY25_04315, partial [Paenisporosarcina sp.]